MHHGLQKLEELVSNINDIIENRYTIVQFTHSVLSTMYYVAVTIVHIFQSERPEEAPGKVVVRSRRRGVAMRVSWPGLPVLTRGFFYEFLYLYCFPCSFEALSTDRVRVVLSGVPQVHFLCPFSSSLLFL